MRMRTPGCMVGLCGGGGEETRGYPETLAETLASVRTENRSSPFPLAAGSSTRFPLVLVSTCTRFLFHILPARTQFPTAL